MSMAEDSRRPPSSFSCRGKVSEGGYTDMLHLTIEVSFLILLSHLFHKVLKHLGQPATVSQMLAGVVMGDSLLGRIPDWQAIFNTSDHDHLTSMATVGRTFFMFLIGLEIDIPYVMRSSGIATTIAFGGIFSCGVFGAIAYFTSAAAMGIKESSITSFLFFWLLLTNTASPVLIRMVTELKLGMSDIGRLAISSALVNDIVCLAFMTLANFARANTKDATPRQKSLTATFAVILLAGSVKVMRKTVTWLNRHDRLARGIGENAIAIVLFYVFVVSALTEVLGFSGMMATFVMGFSFPRQGPTGRTMVRQLTYFVNNFVLPIFFGYTGMQVDLTMLAHRQVSSTVVIVVVLGLVAKVLGTVVAAKYLRMLAREALVLGFLLNVKGHIDLMIIALGRKYKAWDQETYNALLITMIINSMLAAPAAAYVVRRERQAIPYRFMGLERLDLRKEFRVLIGVHGPHDLPTVLDLIEMTARADHVTVAPYIMHLIEFTGSVTTNMLYNQIEDGDHDEDELGGGGEGVRQLNAAVDAFVSETDVRLCQLQTFSKFDTMHRDLCNTAHDLRAVMVIVPFQRRMRVDGKMGADHEGIRTCNRNVLEHAPCSVGILVDRGFGGVDGKGDGEEGRLHRVVVLFFGGADDREAVAYGIRLAMHPCVSLTVVRFLSTCGSGVYLRQSTTASTDVLMDVMERDDDELFITNFHNRFVSSGIVEYMERLVGNSAETVRAMSSMEGMYSLFIVGRERHGPTTRLTSGMSEWEDCKELGFIGDLLASSDFMSTGSVLVIQQHRVKKKITDSLDDDDDDEDDNDIELVSL